MKVIKKIMDDGNKCEGCNWKTTSLFSLDFTDVDNEGLCGNCFCDMLIEDGCEIKIGVEIK